MKFPYRIPKPCKLNNTYLLRRTMRDKIFYPIVHFFKEINASWRVGFKLIKSPNRTSFIVWETLEFPTTENPNFSFLHSLEVCTRAPKPDESRKSILLKSITIGKGSFLITSMTKVLNCFSENASNCPLKVKTIILAVTSTHPLKETVSFWKSSMIKSLQKK